MKNEIFFYEEYWRPPWWHRGGMVQYILIFIIFIFKRAPILAFVQHHQIVVAEFMEQLNMQSMGSQPPAFLPSQAAGYWRAPEVQGVFTGFFDTYNTDTSSKCFPTVSATTREAGLQLFLCCLTWDLQPLYVAHLRFIIRDQVALSGSSNREESSLLGSNACTRSQIVSFWI